MGHTRIIRGYYVDADYACDCDGLVMYNAFYLCVLGITFCTLPMTVFLQPAYSCVQFVTVREMTYFHSRQTLPIECRYY